VNDFPVFIRPFLCLPKEKDQKKRPHERCAARTRRALAPRMPAARMHSLCAAPFVPACRQAGTSARGACRKMCMNLTMCKIGLKLLQSCRMSDLCPDKLVGMPDLAVGLRVQRLIVLSD
jgi:hypothetical protein